MNYINKLEQENKKLENNLLETEIKIVDFLMFLNSDKFAGPCNNFINTKEVYQFLLNLSNDLLTPIRL